MSAQRNPSAKVWLYVTDNRNGGGEFKQYKRDDPRLDWKWPHSIPGQVRLQLRKDGSKWQYAYYGETPEEAAAGENQYRVKEIRELEEKIKTIMAKLVRVPEDLKR